MKTSTTGCVAGLTLIIAIVLLSWRIRLTIPTPPGYEEGAGVTYATELADSTQRLSLVMLVSGWTSVLLGGVLAIAGSILGSEPLKEGNSNAVKVLTAQRGLVCTVLAVVLAGVGWQLIDRSASATKTASIATAAIATATTREDGDGDIRAYEACVAAKSAWLEGRMNNDRLQTIIDDLAQSTGKKESTQNNEQVK